MTSVDHVVKKNVLWSYIKRFGRLCGEDDEFVKVYANEVYYDWIDDIDTAIECFRELLHWEEFAERMQTKRR